MTFHWVTRSGYGMSVSWGRFGIDAGVFLPKDELTDYASQSFLFGGLFVGPLIVLAVEARKEQMSVTVLNIHLSLIWAY